MLTKIRDKVSPEILKIFILSGYTAIVSLAATLRFIFVSKPNYLSFDEIHYIPNGYSLFLYGYIVRWFNFSEEGYDTKPVSERFAELEPYDKVLHTSHPPLGQYLIGFFVQFDPLNPTMWRLSSAIFGVLTVLLIMLIIWQITRKHSWVLTGGAFAALSNLNIAMSNIGILDIFLTFFTLLGVYFSIIYVNRMNQQLGSNKYLILAVTAFAFAVSVKWSALYYIALFALAILVYQIVFLKQQNILSLKNVAKRLGKNFAVFIIIPVTYFLLWLPSIINFYMIQEGKSFNNALKTWFGFNITKYDSLTGLSYEHAYRSNALEWLWVARPIRFVVASEGGGMISVSSAMPNLLLWFSGLAAIIGLIFYILVKKDFTAGKTLIILGFIAGWAPWLLYSERTIFQFYTIIFEPYMIIALIIMMSIMMKPLISVTLSFLILLTGFVFYPISSGMPITPDNFAYNFEKFWTDTMITNGLYDVEQLSENAYKNYYDRGVIQVPYSAVSQEE